MIKPTAKQNADPSLERDTRILLVYEYLLRGMTIRQITLDKGIAAWNLSAAEFADLYQSAHSEISARAVPDVDFERGRSFARLDYLFFMCVRIQDFPSALQVQKEINRLADLRVTRTDRDKSANEKARALVARIRNN